MVETAPYGAWSSPLSAAEVARGGRPIGGGAFVDDDVWWLEIRPEEGGRSAICRQGPDGAVVDVLPAPWNARTRVHEYGGGSWLAVPGPALVFAHFDDQRLYRLDPGAGAPVPLTPAAGGMRFAEPRLSRDGRELWCVRETHDVGGIRGPSGVQRDLVAVPLDGSAAGDPAALRTVLGGSHFLAAARVSPDGRRVAWIAWEHPQMPWDGTELRVADLGPDGVAGPARTLLGGLEESVLQPEWADDGTLYVLSDRSGWWNLYRLPADGGEPEPLCPRAEEFAGPMWVLGSRWYAVRPDATLLVTHGTDERRLGRLDPATGTLTDLDLGEVRTVTLSHVAGSHAVVVGGGPRVLSGVRTVDLDSGAVADVRLAADEAPDPALLAMPESREFAGPGGREVHAHVYPPTNPDFRGPEGERPPYVAFVHGGPTAQSVALLNREIAFFTSRGIGVVDVNYGGSTGYGREYRNRLRGQWGVVDVEDTVAVVQALGADGIADPARLAIRGGSAGGWTTLACLTRTDAFACGTSYYGVAELIHFAADTHDFESRYLDTIVGPPENRERYDERAPLSHVDELSCPVLLLQGLDDPIVPPSQAEMFRDALVRKGLRHAYLTFAGESHGFRKAETIVAALEAELSFYGQVLGFDPPGIPVLALTGTDSGSR